MCGSQNRQILPIDGEGLITPSLETDALAVKLRNSGALFPLLPRITEYAEPPYMGEIVTNAFMPSNSPLYLQHVLRTTSPSLQPQSCWHTSDARVSPHPVCLLGSLSLSFKKVHS